MAEHESGSQQKQETVNQKQHAVKQKPQPLFDHLHAWEQGLVSLSETPFYPSIDEHTALLSRIPFAKQRHDFILHLQQTYGNRYVQRLIESMKVQGKLNVSSPNDIYEQEADRVAKAVTRAAKTEVQRQAEEEEEEEEEEETEEEEIQTKQASHVQRQEEEPEEEEEEPIQTKIQLTVEEEEEELQTKPAYHVQRQEEEPEEEEEEPIQTKIQLTVEEEEEELQTKPAYQVQRQEEEPEEEEEEPIQTKIQLAVEEEEELQEKPVESQTAIVPENLETSIKAERGGGHPLSDTVREPMEHAFGADFSGVRVHTDSESDALNQQLNARAFTTGQDVFFRENEYSPGSDSGRELIAHELTHVVQQGGAQQLQGKVTGGHPTSRSLKQVQRLISADEFSSKTKPTLGGKGKSGQFFQEVTDKLTAINLETDPIKKHKAMQELRKKLQDWLKDPVSRKSPGRKHVVNLKSELTKEIRAVDIKYKTYGQIKLLKLKGLKKYITEKPNWHIRSTLSDEERQSILAIHAFALEEGTLAACVGYKVSAILAISGSIADKLAHLRFYVKAVTKDQPFSLTKENNANKANKYGQALKKLSASFPDYVLKSAMDEKSFKRLLKLNYVNSVIKYYTTASQKPIFQAEKGEDFNAYINMKVIDKKDPLSYDKTVLKGKIRNFHRFQARALNKLVSNYGNTSPTRPLALILHSALDHNGAFHRDPQLTAVITNSKINALMIEGGETLADYRGQITPLAQKYGLNKKIDQVMFAGHGGSRSIDLAGKVEKDVTSGKLKEKGRPIDLVNNKVEADKMFDEVLKNMDKKTVSALAKQKNRRIIFNACLTNSNAIRAALSGNQALAKQEIKAYIQANASLATYLHNRAVSKGYDVKSLGANASIGQVSLIEASKGKLTIKSAFDPYVTASKIKYAQFGKEPEGALWAALESWATDTPATLTALDKRSKKKSKTWDNVIIQSIYALIVLNKTEPNLGEWIRTWAYIAGALTEMQREAECRVKTFAYYADNEKALSEPLFPSLARSNEWSSKKYIPLVFYQLWMRMKPGDASLKTKFLAHLGAKFNVKTAREYIDMKSLVNKGLIIDLVTGSGSKAKDILALLGVLTAPPQNDCKTYLKGRRKPAVPEVVGLPAVPAVPPVPRQYPPRKMWPKVPAVPGRPKVAAIPGKRKAVAAVRGLPELPELPAVPAPTGKTGGKVVKKAPGRRGRPARKAVPAVPEVAPYFDKSLKINKLLAGVATEEKILSIIK